MPHHPQPGRRPFASTGLVSLVGAGPGDPEHLTLKAVRRLAEADLVLYDALVTPAVHGLAGRARRFFVGKRAGRPGTAQTTIHKLMIRWARRGYRVVRLKSGDPFIFGRGGEEMLALSAAGIAFEVIPGVSAAVAAPELAGIPLTHRGVSSAFIVLTGHDPAIYAWVLGGLPPNGVTIVVLMGLGSRRELGEMLGEHGWRPDTPAAILGAASTAEAFTWTGSLSGLGAASLPDPWPAAYGTVIVGDVVGLSRQVAASFVDGAHAVSGLALAGAMAR